MHKPCKRCGTETERNNEGRCIPCKRIKDAKWYAANKERKSATNAARYQANTEKLREQSYAWRANNKEKSREINKASAAKWQAKNKEKYYASMSKWRAEHPEKLRVYAQNRRALKKSNGGKLSNGIISKLLELQKNKCVCCKQPLGNDYHVDHIVPLKLGGTNTDDNVQLLHSSCNRKKHAKHPVDHMQTLGFLL